MFSDNARRFVFKIIYLIVVCVTCYFTACVQANRTISRPSITPNKDWQFVERSPYGVTEGDHLIGHGLKIRIEAFNASQIPQLVVRMGFFVVEEVPIKFIPSATTVELSSGQIAQATGYECRAALMENLAYRKSVHPIREIVFSQKDNCIDLYFDVPPPSVEDVFKMRIGGVSVRGKDIRFPEITFRKGIAKW